MIRADHHAIVDRILDAAPSLRARRRKRPQPK